PQEALLGSELGLALGGDFTHKDVVCSDFGAYINDAALVEVLKRILADIWNVPCNLFRPELGLAGFDLVFLDVYRSEHIVLHEALRDQDCVLEVAALEAHEGHDNILAQRELAVLCG